MFEIIVKLVNNTAGLNEFVFTLLVFRAYPKMHFMDPPALRIIQQATIIKKTLRKV